MSRQAKHRGVKEIKAQVRQDQVTVANKKYFAKPVEIVEVVAKAAEATNLHRKPRFGCYGYRRLATCKHHCHY